MALDSRKKIRHVHSCGCVLFGFHFPRGYLCECAVGLRCGVGWVARASCLLHWECLVGALVCVWFRTLTTRYWRGGVGYLFADDGWQGWRVSS